MANPIDIFVTESAFKQLEKTIALITNADKELLKISQTALNFNKNLGSIRNPTDLGNNSEINLKTLAQLQKQNIAIDTLKKKYDELKKGIDKTIPSNIAFQKQLELETKTRQSLDAQRQKALKEIEKEQSKLNAASGAYNKLQSEMNALSFEYKNLAVKKELDNNLTESESKRYETLQKSILKYDTALKAVDASIGKYSRNVGNYSGAFNPLSNSINQLTREAPAFANSIGTGFMAVSNNFPAFFDAISQINAKNKELIANGEPTKSVFKELASSLFSVQTLLSVGVTLLTIYGEQIVEAAMSIDIFSKSADAVKESLININSQSVAQSKNLDKYRDVVNDTNLSEKERNNALNLLKESIPQLNKVTLEQANALELVNNWTDKYVKNAILRYKADELIKKSGEEMILQDKLVAESRGGSKAGFIDYVKSIKLKDVAMALNPLAPGTIDFKDLKKRASQESEIRVNKEISASKKSQQTYETEAQNIIKQIENFDKLGKSKDKLNKPRRQKAEIDFDYLKAELEREKAQIEQRKSIASEGMNNEKLSFQQRIKFREQFSRISIELIDKEYDAENKLNKKKADDDKAKVDLARKNGDINPAKQAEEKSDIDRRYKAEFEKSDIELSNKIRVLKIEDQTFNEKINEQNIAFAKKTSDLIFASEKSKQLAIANNEKLTTEVRQRAFNEYVRIAKAELELAMKVELAKVPKGNQAQIDSIIQSYKNAIGEIEKIKSPKILKIEELEQQAKEYAQSFSKSFLGNAGLGSLNIFTDLDINGKSTFENLLTNAQGFGQKFAVIMGSVGNVAKEVFAFIRDSSQENFDKEREQLERQYEISTSFAGDSVEAKKQIDKQYQEKQKEIKNREAKANKELALFNIAINTAQAVVSALPNIPLSITIGVVGALQLAAVASKEIPKYFQGGIHDGGLGMINDGGGSNYVETVKTPDGKFSQYSGRNLVLDMPKGTEILTAQQWQDYQMNELLRDTGVLRANVNFNKNVAVTGFSDAQVNRILQGLQNIPTSNLNFDNGKFQNHVKNGHQTQISLNTRVTFAGETL